MYLRDLLERDKIEEVTAETFLEVWKRLNSSIGHVAYVTGKNDDRLFY
jgi:hypothetical protein